MFGEIVVSRQLWLDEEANKHAFQRVGAERFEDAIHAKVVSAAAGYSHSAAVTEDGAVWTLGAFFFGQLGHGDEEGHAKPTRVMWGEGEADSSSSSFY